MKKTKRPALRHVLCIVIVMVMLFGTVAPCLAAESGAMTVKVGFFAFDGYHMQDENGTRSGYGYEMLQHLAGYAGFRCEYIGYDKSWSEMQDMLANGEIDILTSAQKTPEREAQFDFSATNIGVSAAILTVKAGDTAFNQSDYTNWNGIRVGMIEGNSRNESFAEYAEERGFTYTSVYFDSTDDMVAELQAASADKIIDAILTSNLRRADNEWILAQFDSSPFFAMAQKGNTALLERINSAIAQLDVCEPGLRTKLMNKYYATSSSGEIAFSPEERAYIESMRGQTLTALINPDRAPYSWYENGAYHGILIDIARLVIKRSGLNVEFAKAHDRAEYQRLIESGCAALRFDMDCPYSQAEQEGWWLTAPYLTVPLYRLARENTTQFNTVAIPANKGTAEDFGKDMAESGVAVVYYDSVSQAVQAVMDEKQDMTYLAEDTAKMAVRDDVTNRFAAEEVFGQKVSYAAAVSYRQDPLMYSILAKAVFSLSEGEIDAIRQSYAKNLENQFTLIGYFYDYPLHVVLAVAILLGVVILILVLVNLARRRKSEHGHLIKERQQNEMLKEALAATENANAAKSQFLSRVSHEMRTPLNAIIGFIELAKGADAEKTANYLASSDLAAKQLLSVINDVLDMSSIESGKMKIAYTSFNFRHMITSIANIYGTQCKQKNVDFEVVMETPIDDWLVGDEMRVNQILMNLLGNSIKFTSQGHIHLRIAETHAEGERVFLRLTVEDTGCGMSEEMKARLFKPFEQESATTAKKYGGSGLGLSIVKNLVSMMDGSIRVESEQGVGTSFIVDLPFQKSDVGQSLVLPQTVDTLRILTVDDEPVEREYMSLVLNRMGVRYTSVCGGEEALKALARSETEKDIYNVCLVDWRMPGMSGVETTKRIREKYGRELIVVVVSAYDFQQAGDTAIEAGANLFLAKPIFQSSLFDLFMTLTGGKIAKPKEEAQAWDFSGKRVLLAEDNALNQIVACGYLSKYNVAVELACDGQKAVDMFTASPVGYYDAILMDIQMPVMDGYEAARTIRASAHPEAKTIQIIAQTADAFNEDISRSLCAGMNAHVAKPIKPDVLSKALHKAFTASR